MFIHQERCPTIDGFTATPREPIEVQILQVGSFISFLVGALALMMWAIRGSANDQMIELTTWLENENAVYSIEGDYVSQSIINAVQVKIHELSMESPQEEIVIGEDE
jgi:hypothetical protein